MQAKSAAAQGRGGTVANLAISPKGGMLAAACWATNERKEQQETVIPAQTFPNTSGRPMYILDDREPIRELL